jgi:hypothetical protein
MYSSTCPRVLLLLALAACQGIPSAPNDSQRQEVEVAIAVAPKFTQALLNSDAGLGRAIESAILGESDVGLRFYAVAATAYGSGHARPPYRLNVELQSLQIDTTQTETSRDVDRVKAAVAVTLEKRRENGPPLLVARSERTFQRRPQASSAAAVEASYAVAGVEAPVPNVAQAEIVAAARSAFRAAVEQMVPAIDRELAPRK